MKKRASVVLKVIFDDTLTYWVRPCLFYVVIVALFSFIDVQLTTRLAEGLFVSFFLMLGLAVSMIFKDLEKEKGETNG